MPILRLTGNAFLTDDCEINEQDIGAEIRGFQLPCRVSEDRVDTCYHLYTLISAYSDEGLGGGGA